MKDQKTREQFIELRTQGLSYDRIAKELAVSKQTLIEWARFYSDEIANLKTVELDALKERFKLHKLARIESFGQLITRLECELSTRALSQLSTDKLVLLLLRE